jgi:DedD protein
MHDENVRVREKFELSLDGRQIASIVVGALVILGVVFVLGLNVGRQITARQVEASRGGDLTALDRVPVSAPAAPAKGDITFYDQLPREKPAPPPPEPARPAPSAPAQAAAPAPSPASPPAPTPSPALTAPAPAVAAAIAAPVVATPAPKPAATPVAKPAVAAPKPPAAAPPSGGPFVVQLAATQNRAEAERLASRHRDLAARIEVADVAGKGRFYRVRAGSFSTRAEAERYLAQASRQSGLKGYVTSGH